MVDAVNSEFLQSVPGAHHRPVRGDETNHGGRRVVPGVASPQDVLDLPSRFAARPVEEGEEGGEVAEGNRGNRIGGARGFIQSALNAIRRDFSQVLKGLGFDSEVANQFAKSFIEPVVNALKDGLSFTAELSFAALSQTTEVSGSSFSQSTSLVARSLEISVNQETGEVAVSLASLTYEENIAAVTGDDAGSLLTVGPGPVPAPEETEGEEDDPLALPPIEEGGGDDGAVAGEEGDGTVEEEDPTEALIAALRENLVEAAISFQAIIAIRSITFSTNEEEEPITTITADVAVPLDETAGEEEESDPLDVTA